MRQSVDITDIAYVLDIKPYRDTSVIAELISEHSGHVHLFCHGSSSKQNGLASTLQLFNRIQICYKFKNNVELQTLKTATLLSSFDMEKAGWNGYAIANLWSEMMRKLVPVDDRDIDLFTKTDALMQSLLLLNDSSREDELYRIIAYTFFDLVANAGYAFDFETCAICQRVINNSTMFIDLATSHCICDNCASDNNSYELFPLAEDYYRWLTDEHKRGHRYDGKRYFHDSIHLIDAFLKKTLAIQCKSIALL